MAQQDIWDRNKKYKVYRNIRDYSKHDYYWNQVPRGLMKELLDLAESRGYEEALEIVYKKIEKDEKVPSSVKKLLTPSHFKTYILDGTRSKFSQLFTLRQNVQILDTGCGWGAVTVSLARKVKKIGGQVYGIDATKETLAFIKTRAKQEKLDNIHLAATEPFEYGELPFKDESFDVVIMNGVLEWVGSTRLELSPKKCQENALKEMRRVLKPDGILYIGIENAAAYDYMLGQKDHSGIRFVGGLPKFLANAASLVVKREPYRTYIYSSGGYGRLLNKVGFPKVQFFVPVPSYRNIDEIVEFDDAAVRKAFNKYWDSQKPMSSRSMSSFKRKIMKFLIKLPCARKHVYSYSILAEKG